MTISTSARAVLISAICVLVIGMPLALMHELGLLSRHMVMHILSMNVAAPIIATLAVFATRPRASSHRIMWCLAAAQMLVLWFLHTPRFHMISVHAPVAAVAVHAVLACLAFGFWRVLLSLNARQRWHAPAALLLTGKLACLLAALLIFSPRLLYAAREHGHPIDLADQQLAGLLMIVACPLSYLTAAVLLTLELIGPQSRSKTGQPINEAPRHAP